MTSKQMGKKNTNINFEFNNIYIAFTEDFNKL